IYFISPFILWRSYGAVLWFVIFDQELSNFEKLKLLVHLGKELIYLPILTILWFIDELIFPFYRQTEIKNPVFIMSQPRSGTTFLLRTLSLDDQTFFSLKHLEWRMPFIALWRILDVFGLRKRVEGISYWPNTELGRLAAKIHFHVLGS